MNYVTGEHTGQELWNDVLTDSQKRRAVSDWEEQFKPWIEKADDNGRPLANHDIDDKVKRYLDRLVGTHKIPNPMVALVHIAFAVSPLEPGESSERFLARIIESAHILSLWKECVFYQRCLDTSGYDGPARTLWEQEHELNSGKSRSEFAKSELRVRRILPAKRR